MSGQAILLVIDDHHSDAPLQDLLRRVSTMGRAAAILTADALLCMRLRRAGLDAALTVDRLDPQILRERDQRALEAVGRAYQSSERDWSRVDDVSYGPFFTYTLIPKFMRTVRHLYAVHDALTRHSPAEVVLIGDGELVAAAGIVVKAARVPIRRVASGPWQRFRLTLQRLRAGRQVRWVNSDFRALALEPGFLFLLALRGLLKRRPGGATGDVRRASALIAAGDRFTADVTERAGDRVGEVIVSGATLPGRNLFDRFRGTTPIEAFASWGDVLSGIRVATIAAARAIGLLRDTELQQRFTLHGWNYWPLVRGTLALHLLAWIPVLHHLRRLVARAVARYRAVRLLVSSDVTAYNRTLVAAMRACRVPSLGIQHGILGEPNGHDVARVDVLATWGPASERWYRDHAPQMARFAVTGNPRFDTLAGRGRATERASAPFTIVVCTGFVSDYSVGASEYENLLMLDAVVAWAKSRPGTRVIQKMHPGEEPVYYERAAKQLEWPADVLTSVRDVALYDLLEQSNVLVAAYSTTVFEAMALGTPAIVLDVITRRHLLPLEQAPNVSIAFSIGELRGQLDRLKETATEQRAVRSWPSLSFLDDYLHTLDGHATDRVVDLLLSIPAGRHLDAK